jgi:phenylpyruvate tautomerase PptA (4-oxalocrotonate tautomerase family)
MPICTIEGPVGLSSKSKKRLLEKALNLMVDVYHMPDDRVYLNEFDLDNTAHTAHDGTDELVIQSKKARPICTFHTPEGLPVEGKRKLVTEMTAHLAEAYELTDLRDVLIFIQEYPLNVVGNNGYLQSENPEFASPATT